VIRLDRTARASITGSHIWPETAVFLSTAPGLLQSVRLDSGRVSSFGAKTEESAADFWDKIDSPDKALRRPQQ
jgi:hypothetical protein